MLLVKLLKLNWFEIPTLQAVVGDLINFGSLSERHLLIALTTLEELIVEMGYVTRGKHLHLHRRISVNFRDSHLQLILTSSLEQVRRYTESVLANQAFQQIRLDNNHGANPAAQPSISTDLMIETLLQALSVLEKCLNYDWTAVLCNETLDEPGQTNLPLTWRDVV